MCTTMDISKCLVPDIRNTADQILFEMMPGLHMVICQQLGRRLFNFSFIVEGSNAWRFCRQPRWLAQLCCPSHNWTAQVALHSVAAAQHISVRYCPYLLAAPCCPLWFFSLASKYSLLRLSGSNIGDGMSSECICVSDVFTKTAARALGVVLCNKSVLSGWDTAILINELIDVTRCFLHGVLSSHMIKLRLLQAAA